MGRFVAVGRGVACATVLFIAILPIELVFDEHDFDYGRSRPTCASPFARMFEDVAEPEPDELTTDD